MQSHTTQHTHTTQNTHAHIDSCERVTETRTCMPSPLLGCTHLVYKQAWTTFATHKRMRRNEYIRLPDRQHLSARATLHFHLELTLSQDELAVGQYIVLFGSDERIYSFTHVDCFVEKGFIRVAVYSFQHLLNDHTGLCVVQ